MGADDGQTRHERSTVSEYSNFFVKYSATKDI